MNKSDLKFFLAFNAIPEIGSRTLVKLSKRFSSGQQAWTADRIQLLKAGLTEAAAGKIIAKRLEIEPDAEAEKVKKFGWKIITIADKDYPLLLKEINDPPFLLYVKGELSPAPAIAVVGSRRATPYGRQAVREIIQGLAGAEVQIVSGLALGIDGLAHQAALDIGLLTTAVLPSGLDKIYPASHHHLAEEIISHHGAVISEMAPGVPAINYNFPVRNRIIAGLSLGVVVIEAAESSGSLLTAKSALDYNREVLAVPGPIFSSVSAGCHGLIKMGAKLVTSAQDILEEINLETKTSQVQMKQILPDTKEEALVLKNISTEPVHVDQLSHLCHLPISQLNATLVMMEMKGKLRNLGGNLYAARG